LPGALTMAFFLTASTFRSKKQIKPALHSNTTAIHTASSEHVYRWW